MSPPRQQGPSETNTIRADTDISVPAVFAGVIDPIGAGFVKSLARPGGNMIGCAVFVYSINGKSLELLKELAPRAQS